MNPYQARNPGNGDKREILSANITAPSREVCRTLSPSASEAPTNGYQSVLATLQNRSSRVNQSRLQILPGINKLLAPPKPQKQLPGTPDEITSLDHRIGTNGGTTSGLELLPHRLKLQKKNRCASPAQEIYELTRQNGYLLAEVALLKETRSALSELQTKTQEAFLILQNALQDVSERLAGSERRLMDYWGVHSGDGSDEVKAF